ncbi:MAG TPA: class I SAM-dependent methyltransferase [Kiritimatiellia bacterium]|nr:class I SAM-dependent methyltransferase [Kiritimatiellia bacterium]
MKIFNYAKQNGCAWTWLYARRALWSRLRRLAGAHINALEERLLTIELQKGLTGLETVGALGFTAAYNRGFYDRYDWQQGGEEWTDDVARYKSQDPEQWKQNLLEHVLVPQIPEGCAVLEIGPGAGRWSEPLRARASSVHLADISPVCIEQCRQRFGADPGFAFHLIRDGKLDFLPDASMDRVWSYDVFVHINPRETEQYIAEFHRVLKPGGRAIIHHSGLYDEVERPRLRRAGRAPMTAELFALLARRHGFDVLEQSDAYVHHPGDVVTILQR